MIVALRHNGRIHSCKYDILHYISFFLFLSPSFGTRLYLTYILTCDRSPPVTRQSWNLITQVICKPPICRNDPHGFTEGDFRRFTALTYLSLVRDSTDSAPIPVTFAFCLFPIFSGKGRSLFSFNLDTFRTFSLKYSRFSLVKSRLMAWTIVLMVYSDHAFPFHEFYQFCSQLPGFLGIVHPWGKNIVRMVYVFFLVAYQRTAGNI